MKSLRTALAAGPGLFLAATIVPFVVFWGDLPDPLAVHWGLDGNPNGTMPALGLGIGLIVVFCAIWWAASRAGRAHPEEAPSYAAGLWFFGGLLAVIAWLTVLANDGVADWQAADEVSLVHIVATVGVALAAGVAGWLIAGGRFGPRTSRPAAERTGDPAQVVWSGSARGWVTTLAGIAVIVTGLFLWGWITVGLAAVGLIVLIFSEVRLTVGPGGAVVAMGWLGIPYRRISLDDVTAATVEDVSPLSYGGWGYRGLPGKRAVLIRGGEAVRLHREGRADLIVTVDDAARGAQAVEALLG